MGLFINVDSSSNNVGMKVKCLKTEISNPDRSLLCSGWWHAEKYLTIRKEYEVYAISKARNEKEFDAYLVCPDIFDDISYYWPTYIPTCYFEVIDDTKPSFWDISTKFPYYEGPLELNPEHYECIIDGDPEAVESFRRIRVLQNVRISQMTFQQLKDEIGIPPGWHIEKHSDGFWKTYFKESGKEMFISLYPSEGTACHSFLQEINPDNYTSWTAEDGMQKRLDRLRAKSDVFFTIITNKELYSLKWEYSNSIFVFIDSSIQTDSALRLFINKCIENPHGEDDDWEGISKSLTDLSWMKGKSIMLIHLQFPDVDSQSLRRYMSVVKFAVSYWRRMGMMTNKRCPALESYVLDAGNLSNLQANAE